MVKRFLTLCDGTSATGQEGGYEGPKMSPPDMRRLIMTVEIMRSASKNPSQLMDQNLADFRLSSSVLEDILTRYTEDMTALATFFLCVYVYVCFPMMCFVLIYLTADRTIPLDVLLWLSKIGFVGTRTSVHLT